jgi:lipid II:glycine glycyltransferase (peptidoglycan interpeptide bridge formation enzyme)
VPYGGWVFNENETGFENLWRSMSFAPFESFTYWTSFLYDLPESLNKISRKSETGIIDLSPTIDELWQNCVHSKRRNMIRKAEKTGIVIRNYGKEGLKDYHGLMVAMRKKAGLKEVSSEYYDKIISEYFPDKALILIAFLNEQPVSGIILLGNNNVMHYWQGASVSDSPNLGQGELLQWEAIKWAKNQGIRFYDLCVIEPMRLPQIATFKLGFTQVQVPFYCITKKSLTFRIMNKIQKVFMGS